MDNRELVGLLNDTLQTVERLEQQVKAHRQSAAVVGLACRFPGAESPADFWELLKNGVDAIREIPADRWPADQHFDPDPNKAGKMVSRFGGFLETIDQFDAALFGLSPREVERMDPQHRLLLEVAYEAFQDAAIPFEQLREMRCGVFVGLAENDFANVIGFLAGEGAPVQHDATGVGYSFAAGRISHFFGLQGPSYAVDTACSSSLAAIHLALRSLRNGDCDVAIAGGVQLRLLPETTIALSRTGALAPDGRCKAFSAEADGFGRGEGCGLIVLKRINDAQTNRDRIRAEIVGAASNHDGRASGFTVPNEMAQVKLLRDALRDAGLPPAAVQYLEAHGTGTRLGDPIEASALTEVFGPREKPLFVGSVKSNFGHLEAAAGIAGVIKTILALENSHLPPTLHAETSNPLIDWSAGPLELTKRGQAWPEPTANVDGTLAGRRCAGVSSFSMSGANVHVILGEAQPQPPRMAGPERDALLLTVSARNQSAVAELAESTAKQIDQAIAGVDPKTDVADLCFTANTGRSAEAYRLAVVAPDGEALSKSLRSSARGDGAKAEPRTAVSWTSRPRVCFMFTGQGSQYVGMGSFLYSDEPVFREVVDRCAEVLADLDAGKGARAGHDLRAVMGLRGDAPVGFLDRTEWTQPALFAFELGVARVWQSYGVDPDLVLGHSVGEFAAACVSGMMSLEDSLALVAARGLLMGELAADGAMASVAGPVAQVQEALGAGFAIDLAADNGPIETVLSGNSAVLDTALAALAPKGWRTRRLSVSHAFHSRLMRPVADRLRAAATSVRHRAARTGFVSGLDAAFDDGPLTPEYWVRQAMEAVEFAEAMRRAEARGVDAFLEVGPKGVLTVLGRGVLPEHQAAWLTSAKPDAQWQPLLEAAGALYTRGTKLDFAALHAAEADRRRIVTLPSYPFQRRRHWPDTPHTNVPNTQNNQNAEVGDALDIQFAKTPGGPLVATLEIDKISDPWLQDHCVDGSPVVPAALFMALALASLDGTETGALRHFTIVRPLVLYENGDKEPIVVQAIRHPNPVGADSLERIEVLSRPASRLDDDAFVLHASGELELSNLRPLQGAWRAPTDAIPEGSESKIAPDDAFYDWLAETGIELGPRFQRLRQPAKHDTIAIASVEKQAALHQTGKQIPLATVTGIDSMMQMLGVFQHRTDRQTRLPFVIDSLRVAPEGLFDAVRAEARRRPVGLTEDGEAEFDVTLLDSSAKVLASAIGVRDRAVPDMLLPSNRKVSSQTPGSNMIVQRRSYHPVAVGNRGDSNPQQEHWLLLDCGGALADQLKSQLQEAGAAVTSLGLDALFEEDQVETQSDVEVTHVVLTSDGALGPKLTGSQQAHLRVCEAFLKAIEAFAWRSLPPKFGVVCGVADVVEQGDIPAADLAALRALTETAANEHPELGFLCLDLGEEAFSTEMFDQALSLLREGAPHPVLAHRHGEWLAPRFERQALRPGQFEGPQRLRLLEYGGPQDLRLEPTVRQGPDNGEIEIEVAAAGLNFRDVLITLGMLSEHYEKDLGYSKASDIPLGFECAGIVTAVGEGVEGFALGARVMAFAEGAFATHVVVASSNVVHLPTDWCFEDAAATPMAFLTALYALEHCAALQAGETVLVHAAAGGVGQAALQIARAKGARVFASASRPKHSFLRAQGISHIVDSRVPEFAQSLRAATDGRGVDVVLNCLTGSFIDEGARALADRGRFIELGRTERLSEQEAERRLPSKRYTAFDLGDEAAKDASLIPRLFDDLKGAFADGSLTALATRYHTLDEASDAFRTMQHGGNIGKIVLGVKSPEVPIDADDVYLITGGMGALGLQAAHELAAIGARHIVLMGRNPPGDAALEAIETLKNTGCVVSIALADVGDPDALKAALDAAAVLGRVGGVVHAAGALDDAALMNMDAARLGSTTRAKVDGFLALHNVLRRDPVRFFVCYSSVAAIKGSPGQANYAAANAAMDALATARRALGLPTTTLWWGPWAGDGMSAEHSMRMERDGNVMIPPEMGRKALRQALGARVDAVAIEAGESILQANRPNVKATKDEAVEWRDMPPLRRMTHLETTVGLATAGVLGLNPNEAQDVLDKQRPFSEMGVDSLMAVELRNELQKVLNAHLPATIVFDQPTIEKLSGHIFASESTSSADATDEASEPLTDPLEDDIRALLDEELNAFDEVSRDD